MRKNGTWYYQEFDRVESELATCMDGDRRAILDMYLDKLHDEFAELDKDED